VLERKVLRIGNSLGVTLPPEILAEAGLKEGETVRVRVRNGAIEIEPERSLTGLFERWGPVAADLTIDDILGTVREERDSH
jgi:antitoxin component of MazEF toxin-antitoxin module